MPSNRRRPGKRPRADPAPRAEKKKSAPAAARKRPRRPAPEAVAAGARAESAREALRSLPGVGIWTAAETAQRAFGDADALSVGDYHISKMIGWTLLGHPIDDDAMVELLEPMCPHRHRVVRLLEASGLAYEPRRGARLPLQDIRVL